MYSDLLCDLSDLNSECFTFENYESNWWNVLNLGFAEALDVNVLMTCVKKYAVGFCESSKVKLRPRNDSFVIMMEKDGDRFWFHIAKYLFDEFEDIE